MLDVIGGNDNGSPSPGVENSFEVRQLNNIEPRDVGGGHAIDNNHRDVAVINSIGNDEFINNQCGTGPDIIVGDQMGMVDIVSALNSEPHDVAMLQQ